MGCQTIARNLIIFWHIYIVIFLCVGYNPDLMKKVVRGIYGMKNRRIITIEISRISTKNKRNKEQESI